MWNQLLQVERPSEVVRDRLAGAVLDPFWDKGDVPEPAIHRIHAYPAKFPAFVASKAFAYAESQGLRVQKVGDVFCGCGTVALEAMHAGLDFWGCDINPVATLIARTKSGWYDPWRLRELAGNIVRRYRTSESGATFLADAAIERLLYWYSPSQFDKLDRLLSAIRVETVDDDYSIAFLCAFSAILKSTSQWKRRATKPHLDPNKEPDEPIRAFAKQCELMAVAWGQSVPPRRTRQRISTANLMSVAPPRSGLDLIVTSPPYVTSYEYADLHQLSSLWLGYASDYRTLRHGSIGSTQHSLNFRRDFKQLNSIGSEIVFRLFDKDRTAAHAVAKYYLDMQEVAVKCRSFLRSDGMAAFVIGNTEYKGLAIDNSSHLALSLLEAGFSSLKVARRRISNKAHTPFRSYDGKFSSLRTARQTYAEEFVILAHT